jgi:thymidylate synthase
MNNLDKQYTELLQDILDNGIEKRDRTGTGTISVFGRQIRHKMAEGFPLLTTKKMPFKTITTELLWFLRGDTNIKYLVDNNCHIWDGDAYKNYLIEDARILPNMSKEKMTELGYRLTKEEFINKIKTDNTFAKVWGDLGPVYGAQWRSWASSREHIDGVTYYNYPPVDQITNLIKDLKTNPDSRRLMVNSWNVEELDQMTLPPCHYGFQVYTRELDYNEREQIALQNPKVKELCDVNGPMTPKGWDDYNVPTRAISLMWNQRSVDTFLGLPFNIASYGLLLEIIAKTVNMVPDELIGNLGDVHLYSNHVEQAKEQIGREMSFIERTNYGINILGYDGLLDFGHTQNDDDKILYCLNTWGVPIRTREPYPLPKLNINTEFWPTEGGSCGEGPLNAVAIFDSFKNDDFCRCLLEEDIQLGDYQSHPTIKAPLSN